MSEQKTETTKTAKKKLVKKAVPLKKAAVKKSANIKTDTVKASTKDKLDEKNILPTIQAIVEEMGKDRKSRDEQISSLIKEVRDGFGTLSGKVNNQGIEHEKRNVRSLPVITKCFWHNQRWQQ